MVIRFLQTCSSEVPGYPFQAGQEIHVSCPSPYLLSLVDGKRAMAVRVEDVERAVEPETERAEPVVVKKRSRRVRHRV